MSAINVLSLKLLVLAIFSLPSLIRVLLGDAGPNASAPQLAWLSPARVVAGPDRARIHIDAVIGSTTDTILPDTALPGAAAVGATAMRRCPG